MKLKDRVAIVTGAGRNIGEAVAHHFAAEGAKVAVVDLVEKSAVEVADGINQIYPGAALPIRCDVSSSESVQQMIHKTVDHWGEINILFNNVAITDRKTVLELEEDEWDRVLLVTLKSVFLCCKYGAAQMVKQGSGGKIINVASTSGHVGRWNATAYTAAKGGVLNLTRSLAMQLSPYNIRVNSLTPNKIGSPVGESEVPEKRAVNNLVGRNGVPEDIAKVAVFLASDDSDFINAADLLVDGGALAAGGA